MGREGNDLICPFLLNLPQGCKNVQRCTDHQIFIRPYCSFVSEMIESALFFINFTYIFKLWHLKRRTPSQMSPNLAQMPNIFNNRKEGWTCSTNMFWWYIYLIYMHIRVCSYISFVISKILDRYMICPGFLRETSEYFRKFPKSWEWCTEYLLSCVCLYSHFKNHLGSTKTGWCGAGWCMFGENATCLRLW